MIDANTPCPDDIPEHLFPGLRAYALTGRPVGGFLTALLENNLKRTIFDADATSLAAILPLVRFLHNEMPHRSHGSPAAVDAWCKHRGLEGAS